MFRVFIQLMPEIQSAADLSPEALDTFFVRFSERERKIGKSRTVIGVRASTVRTYASKLHSFFAWLCTRGHLDTNPINQSDFSNPDYSDKRALERSEIERIIAAITNHSGNRFLLKRNLAILKVFLFAGLRKSELLSLRVRDADLHTRTLTVRGATSKSKRTRLVPINIETSTALEDYVQERRLRRFKSEFLWVSYAADKRLTEHGMKHWVKIFRHHSGVSFHLHRFRHTYACMLGRNNVSAIKIQKLLGHADLRMTQTYLRSLGVDDVRDSVQFLTLENLPGV